MAEVAVKQMQKRPRTGTTDVSGGLLWGLVWLANLASFERVFNLTLIQRWVFRT